MSCLLSTIPFFAENSPQVVVIGAGLAGLTAAHRLQQGGMLVDVYEARHRVGGRVFTITLDGKTAELGAQNITDGGEAHHLCHLLDEFGLELTSSRVSLNHHLFLDGENPIPINQIIGSRKFDPHSLKNQLDQLAATSRNMKEVLDVIANEDDPLYKIMAVRLAAYEGGSVDQLSTHYIDTLFHMLLGGICSVHQGNIEAESYVDLVSIEGGNGLLPEKMAKMLGDRLHLDKRLTHVSKNEAGTFVLTFQDGEKVKADILILAMPCSVYEDIIFENVGIASDRLEAIKAVQYGLNAKIMIPFLNPPSKRTGIINEKVACYFDFGKNLLTIYCTGETSQFSSDTLRNTYTEVRPMLEIGFQESCPPFSMPLFVEDCSFAAYDGPLGYSWPNDPLVKGSYSYIASGQELLLTALCEDNGETFKTLFAPIDNILYFAGEHASILMEVPGTMEAACESGERTARAILKHFSFKR